MSRFSRAHNVLRVVYNSVAYRLPTRLKYGLGKMIRTPRLPYRLVRPGAVVVQVGCPWDLLHAGRSRGIYFSLFAGPLGRVVIVEPDRENLARLHAFVSRHALRNVTVVEKGAWSKADRLRFLSDPSHPAANLVESVFDPHRVDRDGFQTTEIDVDSLDNILSALGIGQVDLISVTTNGSEREIVAGMSSTLRGTRYLSIIQGDEARKDLALLEERGFQVVGDDDRGRTYTNPAVAGCAQ
ncbi:MAG: FkbM family methyltransferase [Proteobacteria bacterium]|nr:FkbM family methyltransferase [Pseudomonadota bacterium]